VEGGLALVLGERRRLEANLAASRIDLNRFLGIASDVSPTMPVVTSTTPAQPKAKQEVRGWSNTAFDLSLLKGLDADIKLRARELIYLGYRLENARVAATLEAGVLEANIAEMQLYRGRGAGGLVLDITGNLTRLLARFSFDGVDAQGLLRAAASYDRLLGKARMEIDVRSEGADQQALMSALTGKAELKVTDGAVVGIDLDKMLKGLRKGQFLGLSNTESEKTAFSELAASFAIDKGQARTVDLRLASLPLRATGEGLIDLGRQQFDLNLKPKLMTADSESSAEAGFEVPVRIQGPWDKPRYLVDAEAVLKNPTNLKEGIRQIEKVIKDKNVDDAKKLLKGLIKR
jgi:AsmA protein